MKKISLEDQNTYRRIYESMRDAFVLVDKDGHLIEWNQAYLDLLGYTQDELTNKDVRAPTTLKWQKIEAEIIATQVIPRGESQLYELEYIRKDGTVILVELKAHLLKDSRGRPEGVWKLIRDITERRAAESALREQEEFFRLIAENSGDFIAVLDLKGRRIYNSPSYKHFFGDPRYLLGTDSFNEIHPDDRAKVRAVFRETVRTGVGQRIEYRFMLPDGAIRHMESRGGVILDSEGRPRRVVVVANDITERRQAEEKIFRLAYFDALTQIPNRRMLNDRLQQAMALARRSRRYGALMFIDLDNFKPINDAYGHSVGDILLIEAAKRITQCVREVDTVARFGGDEFVGVLGDLDSKRGESIEKAILVAEKIQSSLAEPYSLPTRIHGACESTVVHRCTCSIGIALFLGRNESDEDILRWADMAMYQAKDAGRNRIHVYQS